ncbi:MAG: PLP-dependent aminotransferase family protein [Pseudomonadota bacterium]|nr:PLP-dependent aminotransferase family protein [Pseudomonadota bacterium]
MAGRKISASSLARLMGGWQADSARLPAYRQIQQALRLLILDGRLPIGIKLPGERHLAAELGVSRTTVATAFAELRQHGFASSQHGSGTVTRLPSEPARPQHKLPDTGGIEFSVAALPAPKEVHAAYVQALAELPRYLPGTGYEPVGLAELRAVIADRYTRRGARTSPDEILVTQGAQHGLTLLLGLLTRPGDHVAVDHPTYAKALEAIGNASCRAVPVPLPETGWDVEQLRGALTQTGARLAYLIPDFHNPTGRCMDEFTRTRVARLAAELDRYLLVDETMADLWLEAPPPPPLAAFDRARKTVTLGSMGKSFWGGIRIGWIRANRELIATLAASRASNDMGSPILEQLAATVLLERPGEALAERRAAIRGQRDHLLSLVRDRLPDWKFETPPGGLSVWAELPQPVSTALAVAAREHGVRIAPGTLFGVDGAFERFVRLPYALSKADLTDVVDRLVLAWERIASGSRPQRRDSAPDSLTLAI